MTRPVVQLENLSIAFGDQSVVHEVNLTLHPGELLGLVGESGSGKSVTARSLLRLDEARGAKVQGSIRFQDQGNLLELSEPAMRSIRGNRIAWVPQDPLTSLNPVQRVGTQVAEVLQVHKHLDRKAARIEVETLFEQVGLPDPKGSFRAWPHEFSGGMRQRVVIAMALACEPDLLIADEPTTALDPTTQNTILDLFRNPCREQQTALLFITHDLGLVSGFCDRIAVMYAGHIVETGPVNQVLNQPAHPYTRALLKAAPRPDGGLPEAIPGEPAGRETQEKGCPFRLRCPLARDLCREQPPMHSRTFPDHQSACWVEDDA